MTRSGKRLPAQLPQPLQTWGGTASRTFSRQWYIIPIEQGAWRISLQIFEDGRFSPIGTIHATCGVGYFGSEPELARLTLPNNQLQPDELSEVVRLMREGAAHSLQLKGLAKAGADDSEAESTRKSS